MSPSCCPTVVHVPCQSFLGQFYEEAAQEAAAADEALTAAEKSFAEVAGFLNGSGNKLEAPGFFDLVTSFANNLDKARTDNEIADAKVREASVCV